jgi:hypothetical protein
MKKMSKLLPIIYSLILLIFYLAFSIYYFKNLYPHCSFWNYANFECNGSDFFLIGLIILHIPLLLLFLLFFLFKFEFEFDISILTTILSSVFLNITLLFLFGLLIDFIIEKIKRKN